MPRRVVPILVTLAEAVAVVAAVGVTLALLYLAVTRRGWWVATFVGWWVPALLVTAATGYGRGSGSSTSDALPGPDADDDGSPA